MKKILFYSTAIVVALLGSAFTIQEIINWKIDHEKAMVKFTMNAHGQELIANFKNVKGDIKFDPDDLANSSFNCAVEVAGINTGVSERDGHLQEARWFDAANYPDINFKSSKIEKAETHLPTYIVTGMLSIKGKIKEISFPFDFENNIFNGNFMIKRSDFTVGKSGGDVSDEVVIHLEIPVTKM